MWTSRMPIPPSQLRAQENCSLFTHWEDTTYVDTGPEPRKILAAYNLPFSWEAKNWWLLPFSPGTWVRTRGAEESTHHSPSSGIALMLLKTLHPHTDSLTSDSNCEVHSCLVLPSGFYSPSQKEFAQEIYQAPEICVEGELHISNVNAKQQNIRT